MFWLILGMMAFTVNRWNLKDRTLSFFAVLDRYGQHYGTDKLFRMNIAISPENRGKGFHRRGTSVYDLIDRLKEEDRAWSNNRDSIVFGTAA